MDAQTPDAYYLTTIPLDLLEFGHTHPQGSINVRAPTTIDAQRMAASIEREGLLQPLLVVGHDGANGRSYFVVIGGRRLAGLKLLNARGTIAHDAPIPATVAPDMSTADLLAKSLIAEESHLPPHPVDRFESFAQLRRLEVSIPDIAARHFLDERVVKQCLALGDLHAEVRQAWRTGEISGDVARLFTLADDAPQQLKTLDRLRSKFGAKLKDIGPETVRKLFAASEAEARRLLVFVTRQVYQDAGGRLTEDLFAGSDAEPSHIVHDVAKLKKLAQEKLDQEAKRLVEVDRWQWCETTLGQPDAGPTFTRVEVSGKLTPEERNAVAALLKDIRALDKQLVSTKVDPNDIDRLANERAALAEKIAQIQHAAALRFYTPEQRAKSGCLVGIDDDGALALDHGIVKPIAKLEPHEPETKIVDKLSPGARIMLNEVGSKAIGQAVAAKPKVALALVLASVGVAQSPLTFLTGVPTSRPFLDTFSDAMIWKDKDLLDAVAVCVGTALDLSSCAPLDVVAILGAVDETFYTKTALKLFERKRFFDGCSTDYLLDVIEESLGPDERQRNAEKSQKTLAALCVDSLDRSWLPKELRTPGTKALKPGWKGARK